MAKKSILLLVLVVLGLSGPGATAQEQLLAPLPLETLPLEIDDPPPELLLPESFSGSGTRSQKLPESLPTPQASPESSALEPIAEPVGAGDLQGLGDSHISGEDVRFFDFAPALLESSGTWLRRGFWYTEVDVVIYDRIWRRDGYVLMRQVIGEDEVLNSSGQRLSLFDTTNDLLIDGGRNGADAAPRLKLGRFLFRDDKNRDHALELVVYGGGQWSQNGRLDANPINDMNSTQLEVPVGVDRGNDIFDHADSSTFDYDSRLNSFELNYHVSSRMKRDRMELEPSGQWVRRAQPSTTMSLIAGIRYFDLSEDLAWRVFDINDMGRGFVGVDGSYDIRADNDLIGTQLGFSMAHEQARWSIGARMNSGMFLNHSDVNSAFDLGGNIVSGRNDIEDDNISLLLEGALTAKWHLRPNFSLRAGLEMMFLTSLALAPDQINFAPVSTSELIVSNETNFMGGSIGFESYW